MACTHTLVDCSISFMPPLINFARTPIGNSGERTLFPLAMSAFGKLNKVIISSFLPSICHTFTSNSSTTYNCPSPGRISVSSTFGVGTLSTLMRPFCAKENAMCCGDCVEFAGESGGTPVKIIFCPPARPLVDRYSRVASDCTRLHKPRQL